MTSMQKCHPAAAVLSTLFFLVDVVRYRPILAEAACADSCRVQEEIISCKAFSPDDMRDCVANVNEFAQVLDLSYLNIDSLNRTSFVGLGHIEILHLDGAHIETVRGLHVAVSNCSGQII